MFLPKPGFGRGQSASVAGRPVFAQEPPMDLRFLAPRRAVVAAPRALRDMRKLLATLPVAGYLTDAEGRITYFNEPAVALWGRRPAMNEAESAVCGPFDAPHGPFDDDRADGFTVRRPDGSAVAGIRRSTPIEDESGRLAGVAHILAEATERQRFATTLNGLVDGLSPEIGESFFRALVDRLCRACGVDFALVSVLDPARPGLARTIALSHRGTAVPDFEYDLAGTPCDILRKEDFCSYPNRLQELFPKDAILGELGIDAYVGKLLHAPDGSPIGIVAVMHGSCIPDLGLVETLVRVVAARAGAELAGLQARRALAERERFLRLSQAAGRVGSWELDPRTACIRWSEETYRLFGLTADKFSGCAATIVDFVHPDDRPVFNDALAVAMTGAPPPEFEMRVVAKDGRSRILLVRGEVLTAGGAADLRIGGIVVDVTDQKQAEDRRRALERELRRSEDRYRRIVETTRAGVAVTDEDGRIVFANRRLESLLVVAAGGLEGRALRDFAAEGEDGVFIRPAKGFLPRAGGAAEVALSGEARLRRADGVLLHCRYDANPLADDCGVRSGTLILLHDETERLKLAEVQCKLQEGLILNDRLASVGTLAAGVAHEINNPLAYVRANLELVCGTLRDECEDPRIAATTLPLIEQALDGVERVRGIVRGLKSFARADEERRIVVDVRRVIDDAVELAGHEARHRARLVKDYEEVPPVKVDAARLSQVFVNLIVNASQAIPESSLRPHEIRLRVREGAAGTVVAEVSDDGVGMPAEVMARAFEPFFTTKPVGVGTGLGLSICHGIVKAQGGSIEIENRTGGGVTVRVILAAAPSAENATGVRPSFEPQAAPTVPQSSHESPVLSVRRKRPRVLVVDDDPLVAAVSARILARNCDTTVANSGLEASEVLLRESFDVVLCDLMMPGMTGMELHALLARRAPEVADRMVFMTGGAFTAAARAFLESVSNRCLEKPFATAELRAAIAAVAAVADGADGADETAAAVS